MSLILVTGGTGTLGKLVVPRLREAGHDLRVLSRKPHDDEDGIDYVTGDLSKGEGIMAAADGADIIVHLAGSNKGDEVKTRHVVEAASQAMAKHLVYISVVGADRIPVKSAVDRAMFGYFATKLESEKLVANAGVPWTTLRATQFYDLMLKTVQPMSKMPVIPVPGVRFQPIDAGEVAERLVELTLGAPSGLVPEMGGPKVYPMAELVRSYLQARGKRRPLMGMPMAGGAARAVKAGANLAPDHAVGRRTWEDFLAERVGAPSRK